MGQWKWGAGRSWLRVGYLGVQSQGDICKGRTELCWPMDMTCSCWLTLQNLPTLRGRLMLDLKNLNTCSTEEINISGQHTIDFSWALQIPIQKIKWVIWIKKKIKVRKKKEGKKEKSQLTLTPDTKVPVQKQTQYKKQSNTYPPKCTNLVGVNSKDSDLKERSKSTKEQ